MAVKVTVHLPATADAPARVDRHLAAGVDEPERVRHLADVLHGGCPDVAEELWLRHPGCAVLAVPGPDGTVHVRFRGGTLTVRPAERGTGAAPANGGPGAAALAGSLVHALLATGGAILR
ncbi:hypothetical protein [Kitasatospora sp. NPDC004531]